MSQLTKAQLKVYAAEDEVLSRFPASPVARLIFSRFDDPALACEAYILHVLNQPWFKDHFSAPGPLQVKAWKGYANGSGCQPDSSMRKGSIIRIDRKQCANPRAMEKVCLHELAHHLTTKKDDTRMHGHHHAWRVNYVFLVRQMIGWRAARYLSRYFKPFDRFQ